jgi:hypothetical protein
MKNPKNQKNDDSVDKGRGFAHLVPDWLAEYNEEDDFLNENISNSLPEVKNEGS